MNNYMLFRNICPPYFDPWRPSFWAADLQNMYFEINVLMDVHK